MISTRGRYALRVLVDLAEHGGGSYLPMKEVANRQEISLKYMEKILPVLTKNHIVDGIQGKGGGYPCYAIAKSSVNGLTRGLARNLGADRIRINTVSPGWVMTERQIKLWLNEEGEQEIARNQCLPGKLQPQDIAQMVLFLASDAAAMCTAQEFKVDAGWV